MEELYREMFQRMQEATSDATPPTTRRQRRDTRSTKVIRAVKEWKNVPLTLGALGLIIGIVAQMFGLGTKVTDHAKAQVIERIAQHNTDVTAHRDMLAPWRTQCAEAYQHMLELQASVRELQKALVDLREQGRRRKR